MNLAGSVSVEASDALHPHDTAHEQPDPSVSLIFELSSFDDTSGSEENSEGDGKDTKRNMNGKGIAPVNSAESLSKHNSETEYRPRKPAGPTVSFPEITLEVHHRAVENLSRLFVELNPEATLVILSVNVVEFVS